VVLVHEVAAWFRNLVSQGTIPRAFTGVTKDGDQAIVIVTGLPFDRVQRRDFLIWLCRTEGFVAYAYGTHVGIAADSASTLAEGIDIYASSDRYDASKTLGIQRLASDALKIVEHNLAVMPASLSLPTAEREETEHAQIANERTAQAANAHSIANGFGKPTAVEDFTAVLVHLFQYTLFR
jgi:hypothetical protein